MSETASEVAPSFGDLASKILALRKRPVWNASWRLRRI